MAKGVEVVVEEGDVRGDVAERERTRGWESVVFILVEMNWFDGLSWSRL